MPDSREEFVGALTFPGQLMVVWAKTSAPAVVNEKLIRKEYREVYIDLNSASIAETRHFVTDLGPDGLRRRPEQRQGPADSHDLGAKSMRFDGNWREDKMSEADYMKAHAEADVGVREGDPGADRRAQEVELGGSGFSISQYIPSCGTTVSGGRADRAPWPSGHRR